MSLSLHKAITFEELDLLTIYSLRIPLLGIGYFITIYWHCMKKRLIGYIGWLTRVPHESKSSNFETTWRWVNNSLPEISFLSEPLYRYKQWTVQKRKVKKQLVCSSLRQAAYKQPESCLLWSPFQNADKPMTEEEKTPLVIHARCPPPAFSESQHYPSVTYRRSAHVSFGWYIGGLTRDPQDYLNSNFTGLSPCVESFSASWMVRYPWIVSVRSDLNSFIRFLLFVLLSAV